MSYTITRPTDWWIYTTESGFSRIGGCSEEHAQHFQQAAARRNQIEPDQVMLLQAKDLHTIKSQVEKAIEYQQEVEYEHTENMRHDAERD